MSGGASPVTLHISRVAQSPYCPSAVVQLGPIECSPDVPTLDQAGITGYKFGGWQSIVMPAGTSKDSVRKVHGDLLAAIL